jgi:hypothetical protein
MGTTHAQDEYNLEKFNLKGKVQTIQMHETKPDKHPLKGYLMVKNVNDAPYGKLGFDKNGRWISDFDGDTEGYLFAYDKNGNRLATSYQQGITDASVITWYEYKEQDSIKTIYIKDSRKTLISKEEIRLNSDGRPVEKKIYNPETITEVQQYAYDEKGQLTALTSTFTGGSKKEISWKRKAGLLKESMLIWSSNGSKPTESLETFFDDKGNPVREIMKDNEKNDSITRQYEYVFDQQGNWTKRTMYTLGKNKKTLSQIIERTIVYYE